jgi:cytoskeleton protein RodZ
MSDFGGKLRLARERRGVSLRQIAASTKISVAVLEALERNDISKLPGGIFSRAFVRSYAIEVGLDPEKTVQEFLERFESQPPVSSAEVHTAIPEEESSFESQQRMAHVVLTLVLISVPLIGFVLYFTMRAPRPAPQPAPAAATEPAPAPSPPPEAAPPVSTVPGPVAAPSPSVPPNRPPAGTPETQAANAAPIRLDIHPTGDCWVKLTIDGRTVVSRLMHAGETVVQDVSDTAVIDIGNAGTFAYSLNGRPGKSLGADGQVRTARITRETLAQYIQ